MTTAFASLMTLGLLGAPTAPVQTVARPVIGSRTLKCRKGVYRIGTDASLKGSILRGHALRQARMKDNLERLLPQPAPVAVTKPKRIRAKKAAPLAAAA